MRSPRREIISFIIMGQKFRIRAPGDERERIERVAAAVDDQIRAHKDRRAMSEVRAILMAAFEIGYELDELLPLADSSAEAKTTLSSTGQAMDRLLARLNNEIDAPAKNKKEPDASPDDPPREGVQQELLAPDVAPAPDGEKTPDAVPESIDQSNLQEVPSGEDQN